MWASKRVDLLFAGSDGLMPAATISSWVIWCDVSPALATSPGVSVIVALPAWLATFAVAVFGRRLSAHA